MPVTRRLFFLPSLWAALLTAIVCAVVPAGLPATRSVGSAFDPSTTVVALRSRPPVVAKAEALLPDGDGFGADGAFPHRALPPVSPIMSRGTMSGAAVLAFFPTSVVTLASSPFDPVRYARPPPALLILV